MLQGNELKGRHILLVEDEWLVADTISDAIDRAGGTILGPTPSVEGALKLLAAAARAPDAATLNIRVMDGDSFPVADELARRGIPFLFATANGSSSLPSRFGHRPMVAKPFSGEQVAQALAAMLN